MPKLKKSEMRLINSIFNMEEGYCLDFSNRTMAEFFEDELNVEIYNDKYSFNGTSKARRIRAFIEVEDELLVSKLLKKLYEHKASILNSPKDDIKDKKLFDLISHIESAASNVAVSKLSEKAKVLDFDTVSTDLDRALNDAKNDPESAITSACSTLESVCRSILVEMKIKLPKSKDLMSLYKEVRKPLGLTPDTSAFPSDIANDVLKILGGLTTTVEGIGALRTHAGDAHGREKGYKRVDSRIASLSVHAASTLALFILETWQRSYPGKQLNISPTGS
ncbi:abortive infection family protein [Zooshikella marina]|uniref:abortive infection family protein n=1 Tax=Zooshikella ganghwensis TaxID=202772 RepID=UPI001BAF0D9F|nr:abortive infection family protein [Zooshikella ganghwensis]MBU2708724.1 abortive infection family protein [Zooshikella ganghwensis]